jgi:hypothetical protein
MSRRAAFKPITYSAAQVARQIQHRAYLDPAFGLDVLSMQQRRLMACGHMKPTAPILRHLNLQSDGEGMFIWAPRIEGH